MAVIKFTHAIVTLVCRLKMLIDKKYPIISLQSLNVEPFYVTFNLYNIFSYRIENYFCCVYRIIKHKYMIQLQCCIVSSVTETGYFNCRRLFRTINCWSIVLYDAHRVNSCKYVPYPLFLIIIILMPVNNSLIGFQPEPVNGTMRSNMFGYAGAPMPLPRLRPPGTSTISHAFRTPESSTSEEEDRTDLLGRNFQTSSRPKSRSSLAVSILYIYNLLGSLL